MTKHTSGPWEWTRSPYTKAGEKDQFSITPVASEGLGWVTMPESDPNGVGVYFHVSGCITEADARLVAAAPELLDALESAIWRLREVSKNTDHEAEYEDLQVVFAKATGASK